MDKDQELLRQYILKCDKDVAKEYDIKIKDALKNEDYSQVIKLQSEKMGAFSAFVCILRGCLFTGNKQNVEDAIKKYLKTNIFKKE